MAVNPAMLDLWKEGKAVFSSKGLSMSVCEGCFGRLTEEEFYKNVHKTNV